MSQYACLYLTKDFWNGEKCKQSSFFQGICLADCKIPRLTVVEGWQIVGNSWLAAVERWILTWEGDQQAGFWFGRGKYHVRKTQIFWTSANSSNNTNLKEKMCQVSYVMCHVSHVTFCVSPVTFHRSHTKANSQSHRPTPC